jgi:polysaccharide pyruvyl transferase WcaK-like protein
VSLAGHLAELAGAASALPAAWIARGSGREPERVTIVGWWGSETTGDVAILGQLLAERAEVAPHVVPTVVSFAPAVTRETLRELGRADVRLLPLGFRSGREAVTARCVVFGGGPLMESPRMLVWMALAALARAAGARVMLYGVGIGPVRTSRTTRAVAMLLRLATHVVMRDPRSADWHDGLARRRGAVVSFDPAFDFARSLRSSGVHPQRDRLALALRFPPAPYLGALNSEAEADRFLQALAGALNRLMEERPLTLVGIVMHTGRPEDDDHAVYERLRTRLERPDRLQVGPGRHSVAQVVRTLEECAAALTVRFHAMVFAVAAGVPFLAIDYARPSGKVSAVAAHAGRAEAVIAWDDLEPDRLAARLRVLLDGVGTTADPPQLGEARALRVRVLADALGPAQALGRRAIAT